MPVNPFDFGFRLCMYKYVITSYILLYFMPLFYDHILLLLYIDINNMYIMYIDVSLIAYWLSASSFNNSKSFNFGKVMAGKCKRKGDTGHLYITLLYDVYNDIEL